MSIVCEDNVKLSAGVYRFDLRDLPESPYRERSCRLRVYRGRAGAQLATTAR